MNPSSVNQLFWRRFRSSGQGMAGLVVVACAIFIALFCYVLMPDDSPDANEMHVSLALLPPGSKIDFLLIPTTLEHEHTWLPGWVAGAPPTHRAIPVDTIFTKGPHVYWVEYDAPITDTADFERMPLQEICAACTPTMNATETQATFLKNSIETRTYWMGTDKFGRDQLSRLLAGARVSMAVGLIAVFISLVIGILLGSLAGFFRGKTDAVIMWFTTVVWSVPTLLLVIAITLALGKGFVQVFIAVGLTMWVEVARLVRGQIFSLREKDFVEAGRALGYSDARIIVRHVLPNVMGPVVVIAASNFASAILLEAGLSFLGMGAQPPTPSWGMMIKESYSYIVLGAAYLAVFPGLAIMLMVLAFTWLGNGLRDALDTRSTTSEK